MKSFAVVVAWDDRVPSIAPTTSADALPDPLAGGLLEERASAQVPGARATVGLRRVAMAERGTDGIFVDRDAERLWVGDVRLYDRAALLSLSAEVDHAATDLELVARAHARVGEELAAQLIGDFAVVSFQWSTRRVVAFRDHFGIRPLFYRLLPQGIAFASDAKQLLALEPRDRELDPQTIFDHLAFRYAHHGRTFFKAIRQVWPAHVLEVAPDSEPRARRYWHPPVDADRTIRSPEDVVDEWRSVFRRAVRDRLVTDFPVAAYLSGGLDSASIVGAAHEAYGDPGGAYRPPLTMVSALFPGLPADETDLISAAAAAAPTFDSFRWDATVPNAADLDDPDEAVPRLRTGIGRGPRTELTFFRERDVRVVLAGTGGDELGWSYGIGLDLLLRGGPVAAVRDLLATGGLGRALRYFIASVQSVGPAPLPSDVTPWMGPVLADLYPGEPADFPAGRYAFTSNVQRQAWNVLQLPQAATIIDTSAAALAGAGVELRLPYRDVRLAEFVLRVPWQFRAPRGDVRRLQREAVTAFLPAVVAHRRAKSIFDTAVAHQIRANLGRMRAILWGSRWESAPYVIQAAARGTLRTLEAVDPQMKRPRAWGLLWQIVVFEAWLRRQPRL